MINLQMPGEHASCGPKMEASGEILRTALAEICPAQSDLQMASYKVCLDYLHINQESLIQALPTIQTCL